MEQDIIELFIDEENDFSGIEAISIVEYPAIEEDFIALKEQTIQLAEVDAEKRILMGAALVPDKKIFRKSGDKEYLSISLKILLEKHLNYFYLKASKTTQH